MTDATTLQKTALVGLVPPALLFTYQLVREFTGWVQAPIIYIGDNLAGLVLLAVIAAGLPALSSVLGLVSAREREARWTGLALAAAGVLIILANVAARDS